MSLHSHYITKYRQTEGPPIFGAERVMQATRSPADSESLKGCSHQVGDTPGPPRHGMIEHERACPAAEAPPPGWGFFDRNRFSNASGFPSPQATRRPLRA